MVAVQSPANAVPESGQTPTEAAKTGLVNARYVAPLAKIANVFFMY